jgi:hypothetical protein
MNIFKSLNRVNVSDQVTEYILPARPRNFKECLGLAKNALRASQWGKEESRFLWLDVISNCRSLKLDLRTLFETRLDEGLTVLESCLIAEDWESCLAIAYALPEDLYCSGRVESYKYGLILSEDGASKQKGVLGTDVPGCYYAGELFDKKRHGKGMVKLGVDHFFEGDFVDNQKHGRGVYREGKDARIVAQGMYVNDLYVGNPFEKKKSSSFFSLLNGLYKP